MSGFRLAAIAGFVAATSVALLLVPVSSASAAPVACGSGKACMYRHATYGGGYFNFYDRISNLQGEIYSDLGWWSANDSVSSVYNNGNYKTVRFYQDKGYKGQHVDLPKKREDSNLGDKFGSIGKVFNDRISSAKFVG